MVNDMDSQKRDLTFLRLLKLPMYLWTVAFVFVSLLYVVSLSFLTPGENLGVTGELTLSNYAKLFDPQYLRVLLNSLTLAFQTTAICILVGYPFGYFMARLKPKVRTWVMLLVIVPFWTNALIRIYGWRILLIANGPLNNALIALGLTAEPLKLLNTEGAVLLGMVYALIPFMILPTYTNVEKLDFSVVEAARDLGAKPFTAFMTVTVPLTLPGLLAGCVLVFIPSMGLFFLSDLLGGSKNVLAGGLIQKLIGSRNIPLAAALSVLLLAVTSAVIVVYRKLGGTNDMSLF
jgi:spermidine/putrescine transport system permease protein